jgi:hypothetical protein
VGSLTLVPGRSLRLGVSVRNVPAGRGAPSGLKSFAGPDALRLENFEPNGDYVRLVGQNGTDLTAWAPSDSSFVPKPDKITILRTYAPGMPQHNKLSQRRSVMFCEGVGSGHGRLLERWSVHCTTYPAAAQRPFFRGAVPEKT